MLPSELTIPPDNRVLYFKRDRETFGFCSHFHPAPLELDGLTWATAEHFYQFHKSLDPVYQQAIRDAPLAVAAKQLAASPTLPRRFRRHSWFVKNNALPRPDWAEVKLDIMCRVDWAKFTQHADLGLLLLATGDAELVEDSPTDAYWGIGPDGQGQNWAGRVLMEVRDRLKAEHRQ